MEFLDCTVDKNPPANAGDTGSIPGLGKFHAMEQQSLHTAAAEPGRPRGPQQGRPGPGS